MYKTRQDQLWEFHDRIGLKMFLISVGGIALAAVAFSLGLIGPEEKPRQTFEEAAAAAQAKADARNAQADAARQAR